MLRDTLRQLDQQLAELVLLLLDHRGHHPDGFDDPRFVPAALPHAVGSRREPDAFGVPMSDPVVDRPYDMRSIARFSRRH